MSRLFCLGLLCALLISSQAYGSIIFDFESVPIGTTTPFIYTVSGVTAQFSNPTGVGAFQIYGASSFSGMSGNRLSDSGSAPDANIPLRIGFSSPLSSILLNFATDDLSPNPPTPLVLQALLGATPVGSVSVTGTRVGAFPTGTIGFSGATFDSILLSDASSPAFAIDNVSVDPTPEPATFGLVLGAIGAMLWERKRRAHS